MSSSIKAGSPFKSMFPFLKGEPAYPYTILTAVQASFMQLRHCSFKSSKNEFKGY